MRLGILMTNTDESAFAAAHPRDGEKWRALLAPFCPDCDFPVYSVKDWQFPENIELHLLLQTGVPTGTRISEYADSRWRQREELHDKQRSNILTSE